MQKKKSGKKLPEDLELFLKETNPDVVGGAWEADRFDIHGERVYYMPDDLPAMKGVRFLRTGLLVGELKKNRFEPSQALAMCLGMNDYTKVINLPVSDERVIKYLKG